MTTFEETIVGTNPGMGNVMPPCAPQLWWPEASGEANSSARSGRRCGFLLLGRSFWW